MKLITIDAFRRRYFDPDSAPTRATVRRWILTEKVTGKQVGDKWYIDDDAWRAEGDSLVEKVLSE